MWRRKHGNGGNGNGTDYLRQLRVLGVQRAATSTDVQGRSVLFVFLFSGNWRLACWAILIGARKAGKYVVRGVELVMDLLNQGERGEVRFREGGSEGEQTELKKTRREPGV